MWGETWSCYGKFCWNKSPFPYLSHLHQWWIVNVRPWGAKPTSTTKPWRRYRRRLVRLLSYTNPERLEQMWRTYLSVFRSQDLLNSGCLPPLWKIIVVDLWFWREFNKKSFAYHLPSFHTTNSNFVDDVLAVKGQIIFMCNLIRNLQVGFWIWILKCKLFYREQSRNRLVSMINIHFLGHLPSHGSERNYCFTFGSRFLL